MLRLRKKILDLLLGLIGALCSMAVLGYALAHTDLELHGLGVPIVIGSVLTCSSCLDFVRGKLSA